MFSLSSQFFVRPPPPWRRSVFFPVSLEAKREKVFRFFKFKREMKETLFLFGRKEITRRNQSNAFFSRSSFFFFPSPSPSPSLPACLSVYLTILSCRPT